MLGILNDLRNILLKYEESLPDGVTEEAYIRFVKWSDEMEFSFDKTQMELFYRAADGFEFNGLTMYSIEHASIQSEFIDAPDNVMLLGDDSISWFGYDKSLNKFVQLDKPSGELMETFDDFSLLLQHTIRLCIS